MVPACETFNGFCILGVKNVKIEDGVSDGLARVNRDRNPELHISNHEVMHLMIYIYIISRPPNLFLSTHLDDGDDSISENAWVCVCYW